MLGTLEPQNIEIWQRVDEAPNVYLRGRADDKGLPSLGDPGTGGKPNKAACLLRAGNAEAEEEAGCGIGNPALLMWASADDADAVGGICKRAVELLRLIGEPDSCCVL